MGFCSSCLHMFCRESLQLYPTGNMEKVWGTNSSCMPSSARVIKVSAVSEFWYSNLWRLPGSGTSKLYPCFLQMAWFSWFHQPVNFTTEWGGLHLNGRQLRWESAPPIIRPRVSARNWRIAPSRLSGSYCLRWRSSFKGIGKCTLMMDSRFGPASAVIWAF